MAELSQPLLALVDYEGRPIDQVLVDLLEGGLVVLVQSHLLPELVGLMGSLGSLHVEVAESLLLADGGVLGVGKGTGPAVAQPCEVVLVPAEVLGVGDHAVGAVLVADDVPDHFVDDHFNSNIINPLSHDIEHPHSPSCQHAHPSHAYTSTTGCPHPPASPSRQGNYRLRAHEPHPHSLP